MFTCVRPDPVENILKSFWELDAIGIVDEGTKLSLEENDAVCQFKRELKFDGQRYEVSLPWRENHPELCDNYNQAVKRLESVEKQLLRNPIRAEAYKSSINQYHETEDLLKKSKIPKHMTMILSWYDICHIMLFFVMTRQQLNVVLYLMPQLVKRTVFRLMIVFYLVPHYSLIWSRCCYAFVLIKLD